MRNCNPRLLREGINRDGVPYRVYVDDLTGTVLAAMDFEALRRLDEDRTRQAVKTGALIVAPYRAAYHKKRPKS